MIPPLRSRKCVPILVVVVVLLSIFPGSAWAQYCPASGGIQTYIDRFEIVPVYRNYSDDTDYSDFTTDVIPLRVGFTYGMRIGQEGGDADSHRGMWIDWNADGDFDDLDESITLTGAVGNVASAWAGVVVPEHAAEGPTRLRVRTDQYSVNRCGTSVFGEVEDYTIAVVPHDDPYCIASGWGPSSINRVEFGTIDNVTDLEGYGDFTNLSTDVTVGYYYRLLITTDPGDDIDVGVWIDWNQNGDFGDAGESMWVSSYTTSGLHYVDVIPPIDATAGQTRLRIRYTRYDNTPLPCGNETNGEVEDYSLNVLPGNGYCVATGSGGSVHISRVELGSIDNSTGQDNYSDNTDLYEPGYVGWQFLFRVYGYDTTSNYECGVFADWNHDFDFEDAGESIPVSYSPGYGPYMGTITIPEGAAEGMTRIRIVLLQNRTPSPCDPIYPSEVEDYFINVLPGTEYCNATGGGAEYISRVTIGNIDHTSGEEGYADNTSLSTDVEIGAYRPMDVVCQLTSTNNLCAAWIDWNHDLDFDDADEQLISADSPGSSPYRFDILAPLTAVPGPTRLRVRVGYGSDAELPCGNDLNGEVEDYMVNIVPASGYCAAYGDGVDHIISVEVGEISNPSGYEGYVDNTAMSTIMQAGDDYPIVVDGEYDVAEVVNVWVDWNQDLIFDDDLEKTVLSRNGSTTLYEGLVGCPPDAVPGTTRMRIRIGNYDPIACEWSSDGEVEDYSVVVPYQSVCDDFESDGWIFGHSHPAYDGVWTAEYVSGPAHSGARSIETSVYGGSNQTDDYDHVFAEQFFPLNPGTWPDSLSVWYSFGGMSAWAELDGYSSVRVRALDSGDSVLASVDYCLAAYDDNGGEVNWESTEGWIYQESRPEVYQPGAPDYARGGDNSLLPPEGWWYRLMVSPRSDMAVSWEDVATLNIQLRTGGGYLWFEDYFAMFWDDLCLLEGAVTTGTPAPSPPNRFVLNGAVPNPFNPETMLSFVLPEAGRARLKIYDVKGHLVRTVFDGFAGDGRTERLWHGRDDRGRKVASGVYFFTLEACGQYATRKMVLLK
jgi:hypothetical protein